MRLSRLSLARLRHLVLWAAASGFSAAMAGAGPVASDPLPRVPEDLRIREVARFGPEDQEPVRIAAQPGTGRLFVLGGGGDVTVIEPGSGTTRRVLEGK